MASIDGPRTVHDAYRVYANDAPTFEDSIGGLRILADAYAGSHMPVNINAVLTPPFGFEDVYKRQMWTPVRTPPCTKPA